MAVVDLTQYEFQASASEHESASTLRQVDYDRLVSIVRPHPTRRALKRDPVADRTTHVDVNNEMWHSKIEENNIIDTEEDILKEGLYEIDISLLKDEIESLREAVEQMMDRREAFVRMGIGFGFPLAITFASITALLFGLVPNRVPLSSYLWLVLAGITFGVPTLVGAILRAFKEDDR